MLYKRGMKTNRLDKRYMQRISFTREMYNKALAAIAAIAATAAIAAISLQ